MIVLFIVPHNIIGDHVRIKRLLYDHHFMVVEVLDENYAMIVHFNAKAAFDFLWRLPASIIYLINYLVLIGSLLKLGLLVAARVRKQRLYIDTVGENVQYLEYYPNQKNFTPEEILNRAESNLGRCDYNMFWNNCECLVNWIAIGQNVSNQLMRAVMYTVLVFSIATLIVAVAVGHYYYYQDSL